MISIRVKLHTILFFILIIIITIISFLVYAIVANRYEWLTITIVAPIVAFLTALLGVIVTLGLRLIDDTLKRYENFASSRIRQLRGNLNSSKPEIHNYNLSNFSYLSQEILEISSNLENHGTYFKTKLYPKNTLKKIKPISKDMEKTSKKFKELQSKWNDDRFFYQFIQVVFLNRSFGSLVPDDYRILIEKSDAVKKENPELFKSIETLRNDLLKAIDEIIVELNGFYNTN